MVGSRFNGLMINWIRFEVKTGVRSYPTIETKDAIPILSGMRLTHIKFMQQALSEYPNPMKKYEKITIHTLSVQPMITKHIPMIIIPN